MGNKHTYLEVKNEEMALPRSPLLQRKDSVSQVLNLGIFFLWKMSKAEPRAPSAGAPRGLLEASEPAALNQEKKG